MGLRNPKRKMDSVYRDYLSDVCMSKSCSVEMRKLRKEACHGNHDLIEECASLKRTVVAMHLRKNDMSDKLKSLGKTWGLYLDSSGRDTAMYADLITRELEKLK